MEARLAAALRTGPFHEALRTALAVRGLSLHRVRHHLAQQGVDVGVTTLSYWQQGKRRPERPESLRAVGELEHLLDLPEHSLTALLGPPRPRGRAAASPDEAVGFAAILEPAPALARLLAAFDGADDGRLQVMLQYERLDIGPVRASRSRETMQVLRGTRDRTDRHLMIYRGDPGCDVDQVELRALENCRVGRVRRDPGSALVVAELLFDRVLHPGETCVLRYLLTDDGAQVCTDYERGFRFPALQYVLQVFFDQAALPVRCHRFARRAAGEAEYDTEALTLNAHRSVHLVVDDVRPGVYGIRWEWD